MNTSDLIVALRDLLDIPEVAKPWTEEELLRYLNRHLSQLYTDALWVDPTWFLFTQTTTELGFTYEKLASENKWIATVPGWIHYVVKITHQNEDLFQNEVAFTTPRRADHRVIASFYGAQEAQQWMFGGREKLVFFENPTSRTYRVWYTKIPPGLLRFKASGGTTSTITVDVSVAADLLLGQWVAREGQYVGAQVEITSAGSIPPQGEVATVTGFSGTYPSFTMTLNRTLSSTVDAGDTIDMHPSLRESDNEIALYGAAIRALDRKGAANQRMIVADTYAVLHENFVRSITKRQTQDAARSVVTSPRME